MLQNTFIDSWIIAANSKDAGALFRLLKEDAVLISPVS